MTATSLPRTESPIHDWQKSVPDEIRTMVQELASSHAIPIGPAVVVDAGKVLTRLLIGVLQAGGTWRQLSPAAEWYTANWTVSLENSQAVRASMPDLVIGEGRELSILDHGAGVFHIEIEGAQTVVAGGYIQTPLGRHAVVAFFGESLGAIQAVRKAVDLASRQGHVMVWGASSSWLAPEPVTADDVILPELQKQELLGWLDRFCTLQAKARDLGLRPRQGLLLVGPPGTGKTQFVRHLMGRYPTLDTHVFMPSKPGARAEDPFGHMLAALRNSPRSALVAIEDIDQITNSGAVTREYLLNAIDGLFETPQPVLWIATANDPSGLDPAILDRPGRFGRIVAFRAPDVSGRVRMLHRFSPFPIGDEVATRLAAVADGLTGAYLREACTSAALRVLESECAYETALEGELELLQRQHGEAVQLGRELATAAKVGFNGRP